MQLRIAMGCFSSKNAPPRNRNLERLKRENEYAKREHSRSHSSKNVETKKRVVTVSHQKTASGGGEGGEEDGNDKAKENVAKNDEKSEVGNVSGRSEEKRKIASKEDVDGWPKWLVDNIPANVLATLVPKSADCYEKLGKVNIHFI